MSATHLNCSSQTELQKLQGPVTPVRGPFLFVDTSRLLGLELRPMLTRNLHRVVLGKFVFVMAASEEATLSDDGKGKEAEETRKEKPKRKRKGINYLMALIQI